MARIPLTIVTGFLGSGKTTLLGCLLAQPGFASTLVIINEFGEAGIDHELIEASGDDTVLLANGCLCCTLRGNLVDTLVDLRRQVAVGRLRAFDRVLVETSGLADPPALLDFLLGEPRVAEAYAIAGIIATCEALDGVETLARHPEARAQVAIADRLLLTKGDLVGGNALAEVEARLRALNPTAPIHHVLHGNLPAEAIFGVPMRMAPSHQKHLRHGPDRHHHADRFHAWLMVPSRPLAPEEVEPLAAAVASVMDPGVLRMKALLPIAGGGHLVLQGSLGRLFPVERRSHALHGAGRVVAISEGAEPIALQTALRRFDLLPA